MTAKKLGQLSLFRKAAQELGLNFSTLGTFMAEAGFGKNKKRTVFRISKGKKSFFFLGATSMYTSYIGMKLAVDKVFSKGYMAEHGIPTTFQKEIETKKELRIFLRQHGKIILKPSASRAGRGIFSNITKLSDAYSALETIQKKLKKKAVAEKIVEGKEYRVLVANGKLIAVAEYLPPFVVGDGKHSIHELIKKENSQRKAAHSPLFPISINDALRLNLAIQNKNLDSVLMENESFILHRAAPISSGGMTRNATSKIHKKNITMALRVAKLFQLDIAGIDFIIDDISNPLTKKNGAILEINGGPDLAVHYYVHEGESINPAVPILKNYFSLR